MNKLIKEVGPWAEKERFWNRDRELADLIQLLDEGANVFISNLVRDWWKARFEFEYIPAAQRKVES